MVTNGRMEYRAGFRWRKNLVGLSAGERRVGFGTADSREEKSRLISGNRERCSCWEGKKTAEFR